MDSQTNEMIESVMDYLVKLKAGILEAADLFQRYEENKGSTLLGDIANGIEWVSEALLAVNKLSEDNILQVNNKLSEVITALENQDYILVGDLLQYEVLPIIEEIEDSLK